MYDFYSIIYQIESNYELNDIKYDNRSSGLFVGDLAFKINAPGKVDIKNFTDYIKNCKSTEFVAHVIVLINGLSWIFADKDTTLSNKFSNLYYKMINIADKRKDGSEIMKYID